MNARSTIFPAFMFGSLVILLIIRLIANPSRMVIAAPLPTPLPPQPTATIQPTAAPTPIPTTAPAEPQAVIPAGSCPIGAAYPASIQQWCSLITRYANENGLEPDLVAAVMLQESGGNPDAYSSSGAVGLMQVMPRDGIAASFQCNGRPCFSNRPSMEELFDPEFNIEYGTRMLAGLISRRGSVREALFAYGPMDVGYSYADLVLKIQANYQD